MGGIENKSPPHIRTNTLQPTRLILSNLLLGRTPLIKDIIDPDPDGNGVADVGDEIGPLDAEREGGVVDGVDEVVHFGRFEIHEAVDLGLRGGAGVVREGGRAAAEDYAEVLVEVG